MEKTALFVGLTTIDIQYFVNEFPESNKKVKTKSPDVLVGGPAANAAVAFAYLKGNAYISTAVGENSFTPFIKHDFNTTKVQLLDIVEKQKFNPIIASVITANNGDRNIFTHNPSEIRPGLTAKKLFEQTNPRILLLDGFYPELSIECAKLAKQLKIPVVIDGGSWKPQYKEILKYTDVAICSSDFYPPACCDSKDVFLYLKQQGLKSVAISRGEKSILFSDAKKDGEIEMDTIDVVDTLGAGDFLHGAFCYYYLETGDFEQALEEASKLAGLSCMYKGTRKWLKHNLP